MKREIHIKCESTEEMYEVRDRIFAQLRGNHFYINDDIVLNCSDDLNDKRDVNTVHVYMFRECDELPELKI